MEMSGKRTTDDFHNVRADDKLRIAEEFGVGSGAKKLGDFLDDIG